MLLREPLDLGITYVTLHLQYSQVSEGLPKLYPPYFVCPVQDKNFLIIIPASKVHRTAVVEVHKISGLENASMLPCVF